MPPRGSAWYLVVFFLLIPFLLLGRESKVYSPIMYGWNNAQNGIERYWVLYNTHIAALKENGRVSYEGLKTVELEIPNDAISIPLTDETDFHGVALTVVNNTKDFCLFEKKIHDLPISLSPANVDCGNFRDNEILQKGLYIICLSDKNPWVKNRRGYEYGHKRCDLLLVKDGNAENIPISPYNNDYSSLEASYCSVSDNKKIIENIHFYRKSNNTKKVFFVSIANQFNLEIRDIDLHTPKDDLVEDYLICVSNCYDVTFKNIWIDGTYSRRDHYGYGICMGNVSRVIFERLKGNGNWGIFCNNNVHNVRLKGCDINRFDVHCYGKDIVFENCIFRDLYNQFSSVFGIVSFNKCVFLNFIPVLFESSYNAYKTFDLSFKDCVIHATKEKNYLISGGELTGLKTDERYELRVQEYPNIYINRLTINLPKNTDYYLYWFDRGGIQWPIDSVPGIIKVKGVKFKPENGRELKLSNLQSLLRYPESNYIGSSLCFFALLFSSSIYLVNRKRRKFKK